MALDELIQEEARRKGTETIPPEEAARLSGFPAEPASLIGSRASVVPIPPPPGNPTGAVIPVPDVVPGSLKRPPSRPLSSVAPITAESQASWEALHMNGASAVLPSSNSGGTMDLLKGVLSSQQSEQKELKKKTEAVMAPETGTLAQIANDAIAKSADVINKKNELADDRIKALNLAREALSQQTDPNDFLKNHGWGIMLANVGLLIAGQVAEIAGAGPNPALKYIENQIERDIQAQTRTKEGIRQMMSLDEALYEAQDGKLDNEIAAIERHRIFQTDTAIKALTAYQKQMASPKDIVAISKVISGLQENTDNAKAKIIEATIKGSGKQKEEDIDIFYTHGYEKEDPSAPRRYTKSAEKGIQDKLLADRQVLALSKKTYNLIASRIKSGKGMLSPLSKSDPQFAEIKSALSDLQSKYRIANDFGSIQSGEVGPLNAIIPRDPDGWLESLVQTIMNEPIETVLAKVRALNSLSLSQMDTVASVAGYKRSKLRFEQTLSNSLITPYNPTKAK